MANLEVDFVENELDVNNSNNADDENLIDEVASNIIANIDDDNEYLDSILAGLTDELEEDGPYLPGPFPYNAAVPVQVVLLNSIIKIIGHSIRDDRLYFNVAFTTMAYGGNRWFAAECLRTRPELVCRYWNKKALKEENGESRNTHY